MKRRADSVRLLVLFVVLALLGAACAPAATPVPTAPPPTALPPTVAPTPLPPTPTPEPAQKAAIDKILQDAATAGNFSGAALVAQNGQIILSQGYGFADRAKKTPNTPQTKIRIGEITMPFTAIAILMLQERGKLSLQDKLCTYLKECPDAWKDVTLEQLLLQSSGIPDTNLFNQSPDKVLAAIGIWPLRFKPGTQFSDSHTSYIALGKVIEAVSGQTYEAFLQQNIFDPLNMTNTGYDHGQADLAIGYINTSNQFTSPLPDPQGMYASGALYSTVEDLNRWDKALYTEQLVSAKSLAAMFAPQIASGQTGWNIGYGFWIHPKAPNVVEMAAGQIGIAAVYDRYPGQKVIVILLANQNTDTLFDLSGAITHVMIGNW